MHYYVSGDDDRWCESKATKIKKRRKVWWNKMQIGRAKCMQLTMKTKIRAYVLWAGHSHSSRRENVVRVFTHLSSPRYLSPWIKSIPRTRGQFVLSSKNETQRTSSPSLIEFPPHPGSSTLSPGLTWVGTILPLLSGAPGPTAITVASGKGLFVAEAGRKIPVAVFC